MTSLSLETSPGNCIDPDLPGRNIDMSDMFHGTGGSLGGGGINSFSIEACASAIASGYADTSGLLIVYLARLAAHSELKPAFAWFKKISDMLRLCLLAFHITSIWGIRTLEDVSLKMGEDQLVDLAGEDDFAGSEAASDEGTVRAFERGNDESNPSPFESLAKVLGVKDRVNVRWVQGMYDFGLLTVEQI